MNKKIKVVAAISGGVDSSVSAALLKEAGFDVIGIFMKFWHSGIKGENQCCSLESEKMARAVCKKIGVPFYAINMEKEFKNRVVDYFIREYKSKGTPNPCVVCNYEIKFGLLMEKALKLGASYVATGHYARIKNSKLFKGKDKKKDQSYFLWKLTPLQLKRILFPVGGYTKDEVRSLARKFNLPTANASESQEVCFAAGSVGDFLRKYIKNKPGNIVLKSKVVGRHSGLWFYTIGQRKGIKLSGGPFYVVAKDFKKNILVISKDKKDLLRKEMKIKQTNWISKIKIPLKAEIKIRYQHKPASAVFYKGNKVVFQRPQKAVTSGQSAVFYKNSELLGGGIIV